MSPVRLRAPGSRDSRVRPSKRSARSISVFFRDKRSLRTKVTMAATQFSESQPTKLLGLAATLMTATGGRRVVTPMCYQCPIAGKSASYDIITQALKKPVATTFKNSGSRVFGYSHGVMLADGFYEIVSKSKFEGTFLETHERDEYVVLEFRPDNGELMHALVSGLTGAHRVSRSCSRLPPLQTSRHRKSRQGTTTGASCL
jgi:hypothetical protein